MKKFYILTYCMLLHSLISNAQCNSSMAGTFDQGDSCTGYAQYQHHNVSISASGLTDIMIHNFGGFFGYDADATLDCINYTVTLPTQTFGVTNVWGSGTFAPNFNSMSIDFTVDFGASSITCTDTYVRGTAGIADVVDLNEVELFPNPAENIINLKWGIKTNVYEVSLFDVMGKQVSRSTFGQKNYVDHLAVNCVDLPAGVYLIRIDTGNVVIRKNFVKI